MIIGGKDLLNGKRFDKGGYILTYDYDKCSFIIQFHKFLIDTSH